MPRLILARHPRPVDRWKGVCYGYTDIEVEELTAQEQQALNRIAKSVGRVYSSDLSRARVPAERAARSARKPCVLDARLREINMGAWEGKPWTDRKST
ncbi:MAG: histidine phosphatase family protein, partial [Fimbriimonadaceae bacterium]|nr:histidine phosphatase family protein [Fimbriimonadaceae bacterium]